MILSWLLPLVITAVGAAGAGPDGLPAGSRPAVGTDPDTFPPRLPGNQEMVTDTSAEFLKPPATLKADVAIARTPPSIDFLYYPGQTYPGRPWSAWGDGLATRGKYYSSIGDHRAIGTKDYGPHGTGPALVFEYDSESRRLRLLTDISRALALPAGHYTPGKIHSRLDLGRDGRLYFSTHRGS